MVRQRKIIESTYLGSCSIIEFQKYKRENGSFGICEVEVYKDIPCKLSATSRPSSKSIKSAENTGYKNKITQSVKLFVAPEINVKTGSKVVVNQNNITREYSRSGEPIIYDTHQEIAIDLIERYS